MPPIPDLVKLSKLETQFNPDCTVHVRYESSVRRTKVRKEETWRKERDLGRGAFGVVWLERCVQGNTEGQVRAVKKIQRLQDGEYYRELEAISLFSHDRYEQCFVKSFGWYEDSSSIFISMEYLPNGDLQQFLHATKSPMPEMEVLHIVAQILEGLNLMHENDFAHRDLKPANILIVSKGPDWWVKTADFGISKREAEGLTALRTVIGTPDFIAPEILGFVAADEDDCSSSYTNAVDIWSLSVIIFLTLTGETLFNDPRRLNRYVSGNYAFPLAVLQSNTVSKLGCDFIEACMAPKSEDRPKVKDCLEHSWLDHHRVDTTFGTQIDTNIPNPSQSAFSDPDAEPFSAESIKDRSTFRDIHTATVRFDKMAVSASKGVRTVPSSGPFHQHWHFVGTLSGHENEVTTMAFSPDGKQIASVGRGNRDIRLWDIARKTTCKVLLGHSKSVLTVTFSPDGKQIVSSSFDKTIRVWDAMTGRLKKFLKGDSDEIWAVAVSPDGKQIASASSDGIIRLWDSATETARYKLEGHADKVCAVKFSPDGRQLASASFDTKVRIWDTATGEAQRKLNVCNYTVKAIAFSPDGKYFVTTSSGLVVRLWEVATWQLVWEKPSSARGPCLGAFCVIFSPGGEHIVLVSELPRIQILDAITGKMLMGLDGGTGGSTAAAISLDAKQVALVSRDRTIRLWEAGHK